MAYSIDQMKSLISRKGGVSEANVFRVEFPSLPGASAEEVNLLCTRVNIPGQQIMTYDKEIGIKTEKVAYRRAYDDVSMSFMLLNDYGIRKYFETWMNYVVDSSTYEIGYKNEYVAGQVKIQQLRKGIGLPIYSTPLGLPLLPSEIQNRLPKFGPFDLARGQLDLNYITNDQVVYEVILENVFPTTMTGIELGNMLTDQIIEFQVTFSYTKYTAKNKEANPMADFITTGIGSLLTNL